MNSQTCMCTFSLMYDGWFFDERYLISFLLRLYKAEYNCNIAVAATLHVLNLHFLFLRQGRCVEGNWRTQGDISAELKRNERYETVTQSNIHLNIQPFIFMKRQCPPSPFSCFTAAAERRSAFRDTVHYNSF